MTVRRSKHVPPQSKQIVLMPVRAPRHLRRRLPIKSLPTRGSSRWRLRAPLTLSALMLAMLTVLTVLVLATLNCAFLIIRARPVSNQNQVVILNRLPTLTPTTIVGAIAMTGQDAAPTVAFTPTPMPSFSPSPTLVQNQAVVASPEVESAAQVAATLTPTPTPWPTPTAIPTNAPPPTPVPAVTVPALADNSGEWSFAATRADMVPARNMLMVYGEMINDTGAAQQISSVTGTFYDGQGQVIAADKSTDGVWPTDIVPPGGRVPFLLTVSDIRNASDFELSVQSEPVETTPRQDFEFVGVNEQVSGRRYCLAGALKNPGGQLANYLVITGVFYDDQGNILRFANDSKSAFSKVVGDETLNFKVCIKSPPGGNIASHELLAWGS